MKKPTAIFSRKAERQYSSVPVSVLVFMAWRNLKFKKLRSILTVMGVTIGIGAIFFLLSFGLGLQQLVTRQVIGDQSIKSIDVTSPDSRVIKLDSSALNRIKEFKHVEKIGTLYSFPGTYKAKGAEVDTVVYGINNSYGEISNLNIKKGKMVEDNDQDKIVINQVLAKSLDFDPFDKAINQKIDLLIPYINSAGDQQTIEKTYTVKGVVDSGTNSEVYMPGHVFASAGISTFSQLKLVVDDTNNISTLRRQIEGGGFQTNSPVDTLDQINQIFRFFNVVLVSFGAIGMIVSILGMFNTLTISLLERTREIGLMIALGGRRRDMRRLFTFEALLLSLSGAMSGILLAVIGGQMTNIIMSNLANKRGFDESLDLFSTPLWLMASMITFMLVVGWMVVFIPARRAERINPIDALRRE